MVSTANAIQHMCPHQWTNNRAADIAVAFVPDQPVAVVVGGEAFEGFALMLQHAALDVAGNPDVENVRSAGYDVRVVRVLTHAASVLPAAFSAR